MNGEHSDVNNGTGDLNTEEEISEADVIAEVGDDNVGDISVELNVEELVAKIESESDEEVAQKREVRRKLEEINEQHDKELDSTYNFNLDDDL